MKGRFDLTGLVDEIGPAVAQGAAERDATDAFVAEGYDLLKRRKLFSALVPLELGGGGASFAGMCAFLRGLARHCPSTALALSMHQHLVAAAAYNHAAGRPGAKLLEKVASGETVLVSTGASDWMESSGRVEAADGGFRISARKPFASGSPRGGVLVTSAPFEDPAEGWQVLHFAVPLDAQGVSLADDWRVMGMRATGSRTVVMDRVFVPEEGVSLR
ncbi:MAG: acyl-CoA dehydrogenase family protein, partial [Caulobacteraceae bacterium]